ncbi:vegetative cell wall protein gp1-like isoform X2 [Limulus polyphemus]|uniref:Vegetative cell wall protein gp1-like isoform X2 n=1 Tax=Limulus polyphemus TaxID=6850 RepID=A0ABM1TQQ8_LIMPO|nr:vegetative cell wall protein gp1-like isoform X2 [Limulus polyphemus]
MKPLWALYSFLLVVSTAATSASENEAGDTLAGSAGYVMAYPMEEKILEENTASESLGEPAFAKSQDKDRIDETLLLLLPSEEEKNNIQGNNDDKPMTTGVIESTTSVIQNMPSHSMPSATAPHVEIQEHIQPKEEDLQKMLYHRPQELSFSHKSKPIPDEKPELLQFSPSHPKSSPKRPLSFLSFLLRNNFPRLPMGRPDILHKAASLILERSPVIRNDIDDNRVHREPDDDDIIIEVVGNEGKRPIKPKILPFGLPRPLPIENQQYPLPRHPFPESKARHASLPFPQKLGSLRSPNPQMLPSLTVPEIHMNQEGPATPLLPLTPFMLIYSNMLLNSQSSPLIPMPLLSPPNAPRSFPITFLPPQHAPLPSKNIPLSFTMASIPPSDALHPSPMAFLPPQNARFQFPIAPVSPPDFSPRLPMGPLPPSDAPFPPSPVFLPLPDAQFPLPTALLPPLNILPLPSMVPQPPPNTPLPPPMAFMPPQDAPFPSPMGFMPPQDVPFPSPMGFMPPQDAPFPSPMGFMPPQDAPFPSPMPFLPPQDVPFPSPMPFLPPQDVPFPSPTTFMKFQDAPFPSPMPFLPPQKSSLPIS